MPLQNLEGDETDEFGEVLNSRNQSSVVLIHDSCDVRTDQAFDSSLPNARIDRSKLMHLSDGQQQELLQLIDEFRECFDETPGIFPYVEHSITIDADFKPRRLREYHIPEVLKPEVQHQIEERLENGFIRPSNSPMASPIVAVLKGPSGKGGVSLAIDYRSIHKVMLLLCRICWIRSKRWGQLVISVSGMHGLDIGNWA
jgi:hypothetical protein